MVTAEHNSSGRRPRRRPANQGWSGPYLEQASLHAPLAARAYRWSLWSMIPGLGLVLAPLTLLLAWYALRKGRRTPEFQGKALCWAATTIALMVTLTQWIGFVLMIRGLQEN